MSLVGFDVDDVESLLPNLPLPLPCGFSKATELPLLLGEGDTTPDAGVEVNSPLDTLGILFTGAGVGSRVGQSFVQVAVSVQ